MTCTRVLVEETPAGRARLTDKLFVGHMLTYLTRGLYESMLQGRAACPSFRLPRRATTTAYYSFLCCALRQMRGRSIARDGKHDPQPAATRREELFRFRALQSLSTELNTHPQMVLQSLQAEVLLAHGQAAQGACTARALRHSSSAAV